MTYNADILYFETGKMCGYLVKMLDIAKQVSEHAYENPPRPISHDEYLMIQNMVLELSAVLASIKAHLAG